MTPPDRPGPPSRDHKATWPRPAVMATVVAAVGVLVGLTLIGGADRSRAGGMLGADIAIGLASLALIPALLRWPVPAALALAVLAAFSPAATPASTVATLQVAHRRPLRVAVIVGLAGVLAHAVRGWLRPTTGLPYGWWLVLDVVAHAALVAWGALARARQELLTSLLERGRRPESEQADRVAAARLQERTVIAREMHDVLAHRLSLVAASAGALEYRSDAPPEQVARAAGIVRAGVHQALEELREVIGVLRSDAADPGADRPQPVFADLAALIEQSRAAGTEVRVDSRLTQPDPLPRAPDEPPIASCRKV